MNFVPATVVTRAAEPDAQAPNADVLALAQACNALWTATLSLMVAFMQTPAPAHRYLMARKIARNLTTLEQQPECFTAQSRASFARLAQRWTDKADRLAPRQDGPRGGFGVLNALLPGSLKSW